MKISDDEIQKEPLLSEINMVPFIDVVLVLLIIFMVTTPLLYRGLKIDLPKTATNNIKNPIPKVVIEITQDKDLYLNGHQLAWSSLENLLENDFKKDNRVVVYVKADQNVNYGSVVRAMDLIKIAGINHLAIISGPFPQLVKKTDF
ncbi:biopolymer transporter ExbD [Leptospirillum sp. Group II 'CF-1']|nr:biopolymer transporter ExbD [Leptospirillum sp. Group II 'CF-1']AKS24624.1 biopolymer transporter ExbD [Leptospirillum sp. Group II 'CF-1']